MALTIKNPQAEELATLLIELTGETKTQAVIRALEERLDRLRAQHSRKSMFEIVLEIARECDKLPELDNRSAEEILGYDEDGLPT